MRGSKAVACTVTKVPGGYVLGVAIEVSPVLRRRLKQMSDVWDLRDGDDYVRWLARDRGYDAEDIASQLEDLESQCPIDLANDITSIALGYTGGPFGDGPPGDKYCTKKAYRDAVKEWAVPDDGITKQEASWMAKCALAALAGDGATARKWGLRCVSAWYPDKGPAA